MKKILLLAALLLASPVASAPADVLWHGGELTDFTCFGSCSTTIAGRPDYTRTSVRASSVSGDPPANRLTTPVFTGTSTLWLHFQLIVPAITTTTSDIQLARLIDNIGNAALIIRGTGAVNTMKVSKRTAAGVFTDLIPTCLMTDQPISNLNQYDIKFVFSGAGEITVYQNSIQQCTYTGSTLIGDGGTTLQQLVIGSISLAAGSQTNWSEIIIADEDTRAMGRLTLYPVSNGNALGWTNSTGTAPCTTAILGKTVQSDTTYVLAASNGLREQCKVFSTWPGGTWDVKSVSLSLRALRGASGPQNITPGVRISGTDFDLSPDWSPTTTFANGYQLMMNTSPASGVAWTQNELTAAGFNIGFKSAP